MQKTRIVPLILFHLGLSCGAGFSQGAESLTPPVNPGWGIDNWTFQLDNDYFSDSDRDYTSGWRLALGGRLDPEQGLGVLREQLLKFSGDSSREGYGAFKRLSNFGKEIEYGWGASMAQFLFTPENSSAPFSPPGERPYAAWLGAEFSINVRDENSLSTVALGVGVTGEWALGEETQDFVHENISNSPFFNGWDSQLPEEVTVNLILNYKRRLQFLDNWEAAGFGLDGYYEFGGAAGTYRTAAYVGGLMRAGFNLSNDYSVPRLQLGAYSNQSFKGEKGDRNMWSAYLFSGLRGSAVLHDITLDGSLFQDWSSSVDSEPFVGEVIAGAGIGFHNFELVYSKTIRTKEFKDQRNSQEFGSIQIGWRERF